MWWYTWTTTAVVLVSIALLIIMQDNYRCGFRKDPIYLTSEKRLGRKWDRYVFPKMSTRWIVKLQDENQSLLRIRSSLATSRTIAHCMVNGIEENFKSFPDLEVSTLEINSEELSQHW
jgi:hypothetical protein